MNRRIVVLPRPLRIALLVFASLLAAATASAQGTKPITFEDLMKFRAIRTPVASDDGTIVAYAAQPDRGDGEGVVHDLAGGKVHRVPRGSAPVISAGSRFVVMAVRPSFADTESAKTPPKPGMAILDTQSGAIVNIERVDRFAFSDDGKWLAYLIAATPAEKGADARPSADAKPAGGGTEPKKLPKGNPLKLRNLASGEETDIANVTTFAFDDTSTFLAYVQSVEDGQGNGLFVRDLTAPTAALVVNQTDGGRYDQVTWATDASALAFATSTKEDGPAAIWRWDGTSRAARQLAPATQAPDGWTIPLKSDLAWSKDGQRLFFGFKPVASKTDAAAKKDGAPSPYDVDAILAKAEVDIWHWNDPRINSQQKKTWTREKDRTYRAVIHQADGRIVRLAGLDMPDLETTENARHALGISDVPYRVQTTWTERQRDVYLVSLTDGSRKPVVKGLLDGASLSPDGGTVAFFREGQWHLFDCATGAVRNVTGSLGVRLDDELDDTPDAARAYGLGGWLADGSAVLVYDRWDIWQVPVKTGTPVNLTAGDGRKRSVTYRVIRTDRDAPGFTAGESLLLSAYHDREKNDGFYTATIGKSGVVSRLDEPRRLRFVAKAKKADLIVYTRERVDEFPDLWAADTTFRQPRKVTDANPQVGDFAWGSPELVTWRSLDGVPLEGVLIKPANYQPGRRYPVIVYFYERMSQRLFEFNEPVVNHRPSFGVYTSAGYAVFLPDVVFDIGRPGYSATKCVVPGVQKLIDMGIADPKAIGLHGHSWSGYQTAFVVTQTNIFAAAIAGAPVSNMTSAYGGIRWESGLARQFQYEETQSRIGGSLWEYPERYIENSPLFFADRIQTPLLLMHGDEDGAVPWYQSIEMYLAMRRLGKDCVFLQYRGEPHHPQKYGNKLDYSIRMKQYFDHYLKGEAAADWITKGSTYQGK
ncbi:MAG: prolyl oligopeptidase family serine peptidase [Acidobacteriota bacterium]